MFQSVLINTYARRVKTPKVLRWFLGTTQSWGCNYFIDQATPPQHYIYSMVLAYLQIESFLYANYLKWLLVSYSLSLRALHILVYRCIPNFFRTQDYYNVLIINIGFIIWSGLRIVVEKSQWLNRQYLLGYSGLWWFLHSGLWWDSCLHS